MGYNLELSFLLLNKEGEMRMKKVFMRCIVCNDAITCCTDTRKTEYNNNKTFITLPKKIAIR